MDLEGPDILQTQQIRRTAKTSAELRNRVDIGSLRRRRQIADCHVLDHAPAQRAHLSHRGLSCREDWASTTAILSDRRPSPYPLTPFPRKRVRSIPFRFTQTLKRSSTRASLVFMRMACVSERSKRHDSSGRKLGGDARPLARQATIWHSSGKLVIPPSFLQTSAKIRYSRNPNAFGLQNTPGLQHLGNLELLAH